MNNSDEKRKLINYCLIAIITIVGFILRFFTFHKNELIHWDEGIYSFAGLWWATKGKLGIPPFVHIKYSPPLYPIFSSVSFLIFGYSAKAPIFISIFWGTLSIPFVYILGKNLLNEKAGLLTAAFLCVCEYHIIYSKIALTEATFLFFFLVSVYFIYKAISDTRLYNFVFLGISTAITINVKYVGIFPLIIFLLSYLLIILLEKDKKKYTTTFKNFIATIILVIIFILPWAILIISKIGIPNFFSHFLSFSVNKSNMIKANPKCIFYFLSLWVSPPILILALLGFFSSFKKLKIENILLIIWLLSYFFALLFYTPYPRLVLPLVPVVLFFASSGFYLLTKPLENYKLILIIIAFSISLFSLYNSKDTILFYSNSYKIAGDIINEITPFEASIFLRTQANLPFYINRSVYSLEENKDLYSQIKDLKTPIYLIWDLTIDNNSLLYESLIKNEKNLELVALVKNKLHPIVILNRYDYRFFKKNYISKNLAGYIHIYKLRL